MNNETLFFKSYITKNLYCNSYITKIIFFTNKIIPIIRKKSTLKYTIFFKVELLKDR